MQHRPAIGFDVGMHDAALLRLAGRQHGLVTARQLGFEFRVFAAVLAAGDGALASHRCAAALFDLRRLPCDVPEITVSGRSAPMIAGLRATGVTY